MIPLSVPSIQGNEWRYIKECLDTGWVSTAGSFVTRFEDNIKSYTGASYAVACSTGTSALHIALVVAGVKRGDEVLVPTLTFISTVNAISYTGAEPVFMDCDDFYNLDANKTIDFLQKETYTRGASTYNRRTGRKISAIIPVHIFGNAANLGQIVKYSQELGISVIEDAAESLGTVYNNGKHTGTIGDVGCISFNGNKIITTGGGGMIITNNSKYAEKIRYLTTQAKDDVKRYIHNEVGYNYRMTNLQAALGVAQLEQLPSYLDKKKSNYNIYKQRLDEVAGIYVADVPSYASNNYWMYALRIDSDIYGRDREQVMYDLETQQIQTRPVWYLNHLQKPYVNCFKYKIDKAVSLYTQTLNIPCSTNLTAADIETVIMALQ